MTGFGSASRPEPAEVTDLHLFAARLGGDRDVEAERGFARAALEAQKTGRPHNGVITLGRRWRIPRRMSSGRQRRRKSGTRAWSALRAGRTGMSLRAVHDTRLGRPHCSAHVFRRRCGRSIDCAQIGRCKGWLRLRRKRPAGVCAHRVDKAFLQMSDNPLYQ